MDLQRFVTAQDEGGTHEQALAELRAGRKTSHWMWFVFPQLQGLGRSGTARFYGLADLAEARAYLAHPVLGERLAQCCAALLASGATDAEAVLGPVDALKLRSSMTLFAAAAADPAPYDAVLARLCGGRRDDRTLALLGMAHGAARVHRAPAGGDL